MGRSFAGNLEEAGKNNRVFRNVTFYPKDMNESHSIWNENPTGYIFCKRLYSALITIIYPFANFCVLKKSPKNFGFLKWIILFHSFCITCEWLSNAFLIDIFDFQPSVIIKLDGYLVGYFSSVHLYSAYIIIEEVTSTSALILFCSRLLLIINMYRPHRSYSRLFIEFLIYVAVAAFGLWSIPISIHHIPYQSVAKEHIVRKETNNYPDCIFENYCLVTVDPDDDENYKMAVLTILNWVSIGIAIFASAKIAFCLLSRRMVNESEATMKMHRKFNQRTIFQAVIYLSFASIPFSVLYTTILFDIRVPGLTYFIDFFSENHPTACAVTLFLYYDPYQNYLLEVFGYKRKNERTIKCSTFVTV